MRHPNELWCDGRKALILGVGTLCVAAVVLGVLTLSSSEANGANGARFVGDFEVARPGWQQWSALQYEFDRPLQESFELVSSPVRQGKWSGRFTARQGYSPFGHGEDSELVFNGEEQDNDDYWYAWSTLFPVDWREPYDWGVFAQWHSKLATSPQIAFYATENSASVHGVLRSRGREGEQGAIRHPPPSAQDPVQGPLERLRAPCSLEQHLDGLHGGFPPPAR